MGLAQEANRYLDRKAPWRQIKTDKAAAATTLWTAMTAVNCLKVALAPYLPFSSEKLHAMLGLEGSLEDEGWCWDPDAIEPGQPIPRPEPLFAKLDEAVIEQETARVHG